MTGADDPTSAEDPLGPRVGDRVEFHLAGVVAELQVRDGVEGVLVTLDLDNGSVWLPLEEAIVIQRSGEIPVRD